MLEMMMNLQSSTLVSKSSDLVHGQEYLLLPNGVVPPRVVVGGVLLPCYHLQQESERTCFESDQGHTHSLWVEEVSVGSCPDLVNDIGLQVNKDSSVE